MAFRRCYSGETARSDTVVAVRIDDSLITGLDAVRNPAKLSRMQCETTLCR